MPRDIEEFLRKAAERRNKKQAEVAQSPAQQPAHPVPAPPPPQQPRHQKPAMLVPSDEVEIVHTEPVARHVNRHLDTSDIVKHVQQLGAEVGLADDKLEARLHEAFDHDLGKLGGDSSAQMQSGSLKRPAADLLQMFRSRKTIRQAIIISEILKRPDF